MEDIHRADRELPSQAPGIMMDTMEILDAYDREARGGQTPIGPRQGTDDAAEDIAYWD